MQYKVQIVSMTGDVRTTALEIYQGNGIDGDQTGAAEVLRLLKRLFPEAEGNHCNILVKAPERPGSHHLVWWDIDNYEQRAKA